MGYPVIEVARPTSYDWSVVWVNGKLIYEGHNTIDEIFRNAIERLEGEIWELEIDCEIWHCFMTNTSWREIRQALKQYPESLYTVTFTNYGNESESENTKE